MLVTDSGLRKIWDIRRAGSYPTNPRMFRLYANTSQGPWHSVRYRSMMSFALSYNEHSPVSDTPGIHIKRKERYCTRKTDATLASIPHKLNKLSCQD